MLTPTVAEDSDRDSTNVVVEAIWHVVYQWLVHPQAAFLNWSPMAKTGSSPLLATWPSIENHIATLLHSARTASSSGNHRPTHSQSGYDVNLAAERLMRIFLSQKQDCRAQHRDPRRVSGQRRGALRRSH